MKQKRIVILCILCLWLLPLCALGESGQKESPAMARSPSPNSSNRSIRIWQREIAIADIAQASMLGGAAMGLLATGYIDSLQTFQPEDHMIRPNAKMSDYYGQRFEGWLAAYRQTIGM